MPYEGVPDGADEPVLLPGVGAAGRYEPSVLPAPGALAA